MQRDRIRACILAAFTASLLVAAVVVLGDLDAETAGAAGDPAVSATVGSDPTGQPMPQGFAGVSLEYGALHTYTGRDPDHINLVLLNLMRNLVPGGQTTVLRIGGLPLPDECFDLVDFTLDTLIILSGLRDTQTDQGLGVLLFGDIIQRFQQGGVVFFLNTGLGSRNRKKKRLRGGGRPFERITGDRGRRGAAACAGRLHDNGLRGSIGGYFEPGGRRP